MPNGAKILVIDDEKAIRRFLEISLAAQYKVITAKNGREGIKCTADHHPDLVILDLELPDTNGLEVLKTIRGSSSVPVIILTVHDSDKDKETLLDSGADDYMVKPFSMTELLARVRVALRHGASLKDDLTFTYGPLCVDFNTRSVMLDCNEVKLTATEFDILKILVRHAGKIVTQTQMLKEVWGPNAVENSHYLRIYISQLRRKLEIHPDLKGRIVTEHGVGYRLDVI
ncbi:MAG: response regulator transcription factor [Candidatus Wallbacteria bacterium]|nr:response regulator transcription factor [Candidatus Wallbacteria bacterium]